MTEWKPFLRRWLGIALILHVAAALLSSGFYHSDEHFQILEFVAYKLGWTGPQALPVEFSQAMRPWLQPAIYYGIVRAASALRVRDPFAWAILIRLFSALVGWLSLAALAARSEELLPDPLWRRRAIRLAALLWFLPALHARHSSENLGGAAFFIGLAAMLGALAAPSVRGRRLGLLGAGACLGLAFELRYQTAFMSIGALAWLLLVAQGSAGRAPRGAWPAKPCGSRLRALAWMAPGALAAIAIGALADRWGYGQWTFTPWNYFRFNLLQGHVADMDVSPWWDYFRRATTEAWPIVGTLTLLAFPLMWARNPLSPLTWATLPFFAAHSVIGHKELRFLFPMAHAAPFAIALALSSYEMAIPAKQERSGRQPKVTLRRRLTIAAIALLAALDLSGLAALTTVPAWMPIRFYSFVYHRLTQGDRIPATLRFVGMGPYRIPVELSFYRPRQLKLESVPSFDALAVELRAPGQGLWLFHTQARLPEEAHALAPYCERRFSVLPVRLHSSALRRLSERVSNWSLFSCKGTQP